MKRSGEKDAVPDGCTGPLPPQDGNKGPPDRTRAKLPPCATGPHVDRGRGPGRPGTAESQ